MLKLDTHTHTHNGNTAKLSAAVIQVAGFISRLHLDGVNLV